MKKKMVIALLMLCCLGAPIVQAEEASEDTKTESAEEVKEETKDEAAKKAKSKKADKKDKKSSAKLERDSSLEEIKPGEPYVVETESGSYSFTINGVRRTDWMEDEKQEVIVLEYEVENKDYNPDNGSLLLLGAQSFRIENAEKKEFEGWDSTLSEFGFPDFVDPGDKKEQEQPYVAEKDTKEVRVIFQAEGEDMADIVLEVE